MEPEERTVDQLLAELNVATTFGVETGRDRTPRVGANLKILTAEVEELARNPRYFARSGRVVMSVTPDQMDALRRAGAPGDDVQVIRSFKHDRLSTTFSDKCRCGRWVHLGAADHEATCFCGKTYRVVFDRWPEDWTAMKREMVCMSCGEEMGMSLLGSGLNPWHSINEYQMHCDACSAKGNGG